MHDVFILGIYATGVGRFAAKDPKALVREAYMGVVADAELRDPEVIGGAWVGNMMMDHWGQAYLKGQFCISPLVNEGLFPKYAPVVNVEGGCAAGSLAFNGAVSAVLAGRCEVGLAVGVEKMYDPNDSGAAIKCIERAMDWLDPQSWQALYARTAAECGRTFAWNPERSVAMDVYALWAHSHMKRYGTKPRHIAAAAAKNHCNSVHNPRAQYRFPMTVEDVLNDRMVSDPLTRAMCAPIGDAAAAVLICSRNYLRTCAPAARERAVPVRAHEVTAGVFDMSWDDDRAPVVASRRAYRSAGLMPQDLSLVELHDACSFAEIHLVEDLGLCERGQGGPFTASGASARDGVVAVNVSGGLISRGHPVGATGIIVLNELCVQLRGEAGDLQVKAPRYGLAENGGGFIGNDAAVCSVTILERPSAQLSGSL
ncbi:MAG: lipid-transfer protein [Rhodanobacteraceae bacterium]